MRVMVVVPRPPLKRNDMTVGRVEDGGGGGRGGEGGGGGGGGGRTEVLILSTCIYTQPIGSDYYI